MTLRWGLLLAGLLLLGSCGNPMMMNNTDACRGRRAGDLVVSELMIDPDGTDTGAEWIELFNASSDPIDLRGYTIGYRSGSSAAKSHTIRASVTVPPRGYVALGDVRSGPNPAWIAYSYGDGLGALNNNSGTVSVRCGMTAIHEYTYNRTARPGRSRTLGGPLEPDVLRAASDSNWCDTPSSVEYAPRAFGTPGGPNPPCAPEAMLGTCLDEGSPRPIIAAEFGDLLITEVMAYPSVLDSNGEWLELYSTTDVDLNGLSIGANASRVTLNSTNCIRAKADSYVLLSRSDDPFLNGSLPAPLSTFNLSITNGNVVLRLFRGDAGIDEARIFTSQRGVSWQLNPELITPEAIDVTVNDAPERFCQATTRWPDGGPDLGTPGAPNTRCPPDSGVFLPDGGASDVDAGPLPGPNECVDEDTGMIRPIDRPDAGDLVLTEVMPDPAAVADEVGEYFEVLVKRDLDLNQVSFGNEAFTPPATANSITLGGPTCRRVTANTYLVFARNADPAVNGNIMNVYETFGFTLANSGMLMRQVKVVSQGQVLDSLAFPLSATATAGASIQLVAPFTDVADNDNPANLSLTPAAVRYGSNGTGDRGTPGLPNVPR